MTGIYGVRLLTQRLGINTCQGVLSAEVLRTLPLAALVQDLKGGSLSGKKSELPCLWSAECTEAGKDAGWTPEEPVDRRGINFPFEASYRKIKRRF